MSNTTPDTGARTPDHARRRLLAHVAALYYEQGWSQQEIANKMKYSRSAISRVLTEAREAGIVEIVVHRPLERNHTLEAAIKEQFPTLQDVEVHSANMQGYAHTLRHLGEEVARYVQDLIGPQTVVGVSWGTAVYEVVNALRPAARHPDLRVLQLIGALNTANLEIDGPDLARRFAELYGGKYQILPAPMIVENQMIRDGLIGDRQLRRVFAQAAEATLAIVGIGTVEPERSSLLRAGYLSENELSEIAAAGAVGDVCGLHFDLDGEILPISVNERRIGITAEVLRAIPITIGVATGASKVAPIHGALKSGLVNTLFTDEDTAEQMLALATRCSEG